MKSINYILIISLGVIIVLISSCEDDLELIPQDELSEATIFSSYNNVRTYAWGFYDFLEGYPRSTSWAATRDLQADLMQQGASSTNPAYLDQRYSVPSSDSFWENSYSQIRRINIMLDNIGDSPMSQEEIEHWRGIGLFFRSYIYFDLLQTYGGVPYIEKEVTDSDTDILYGPRNTRDEVASWILRDLNEAVTNIKPDGDGPNTVNSDVAKALLARFALFEGTWRKYHNLGNADTYLNVAFSASGDLLDKYPNIMPVYDHVYNSEDLTGAPGILLFKAYVIDELTHWVSTNTRSTNNNKYDLTKKGVDKFLTRNGMPVTNPNNAMYGGDKDWIAEFAGRDTRLLVNTPPPYKVNGNGSQDFSFTGIPEDHVYFDTLVTITGGYPYKELPDRNWSGRVTGEVPNFTLLTPTQTGNGYRFWKIYNDHSDRVSSRDINDHPTFRMGEQMLIHAEASFELGRFDQNTADRTINKLRERGNVAPMIVGNITSNWDPTRDPDIDPVLWEIRRERAVELMGDGFRREDLRRWKKMDYATVPKLGRWVKQSDYPAVELPIQDNASEGYIQVVPQDPPDFPEYYYLFPLPSDQLAINPQLEQNPGW